MKTIGTFLLFVFALFIGLTAHAQIPNAGLNDWYVESIGSGDTYDSVGYYDNPNRISLFLNGSASDFTVIPETGIVAEGTHSAKLHTKEVTYLSFLTIMVPGIISMQQILLDLILLEYIVGEGGIPYTDRPTSLTGQYQYMPVAGDTFSVKVSLTRFDAGSRIEVGSGSFSTTSTTTVWTAFNAPITYSSSMDPDTIHITISSSSLVSAQDGSIAYVDDLGTVGGSSCLSASPPANPTHVDGLITTTLNWDPISLSVGCQMKANRLVPPGPAKTAKIVASEPSSFSVPHSAAGAGTTWKWAVRCVCSLSPLDATPYSVSDTFSIPALRSIDLKPIVSIFPNPADNRTLIGIPAFAYDTEVRVFDLTGRLVDWVKLPANTTTLELDLTNLSNGQYFVQVGDMDSVPLEVTH